MIFGQHMLLKISWHNVSELNKSPAVQHMGQVADTNKLAILEIAQDTAYPWGAEMGA